MFMIGPVGFAAPVVLLALVMLPLLWWLLRAVPPTPARRRFPGVALLAGLRDRQVQSARTPWWLLALRMAALAALILAFSGPVLDPDRRPGGTGPLLVAMDASWADAPQWSARIARLTRAIDEAEAAGRPVALVRLAAPPSGDPGFGLAGDAREQISGLVPLPGEPGAAALAWAQGLDGSFETLWLSDGLARLGRADLLAALQARGPVTVHEPMSEVLALAPPSLDDGILTQPVLRSRADARTSVAVQAMGPDPAGLMRVLARADLELEPGEARGDLHFDLPPEIRNRITRLEIEGLRGAGGLVLADDGLRRRKVALVATREDREGLQLLSPLHYLRQALDPLSELIEGDLADLLPASPDVVILADVAGLTEPEEEALIDWIELGGLLLRFAGPRLAAADPGLGDADPLLPVRLRRGGRSLGGSMSWGEPRALAPFAPGSPFQGLVIPDEVSVRAQVLAEPDPELGERAIAMLADGTPLVTRRQMGQGQVVLFHVTANAEWSSLPLSGLFVQMLERLAVSARVARPAPSDLEGTSWQAERVLDGFGTLHDGTALSGVPGADLARALGPGAALSDLAPGLYASADQRLALNVIGPDRVLEPAVWGGNVAIETETTREGRGLKGPLLGLALLALLLDVLATGWLSGRLRRGAGLVAVMAGLWLLPADQLRAQDEFALRATREVVLGHVLTGDARVDELAAAGLKGLGEVLRTRTTIEPGAPVAIDLERDELAFLPFLYWPVTAGQAMPSLEAYRRLNQFLRTGGMILFDTRDGDTADFGGATAEGRMLQMLAAPLDIPPLQQIPEDHVLTRTFYLLQAFPGRHDGGAVWVEASPEDDGKGPRATDGVTPVVIGGADWAAAWATDAADQPMVQVGRGFAGQRQREMASRFGVNLIMHALTGNYKSDQVHVPELLGRLGR